MQCETCHGSGSVGPLPVPCADCGGSGVAHCCDGLQDQRHPGDETPDWPARLVRMERQVVGHGRECADDCVHPDHGHSRTFGDLALRRINLEIVRRCVAASSFLRSVAKPDTHDEWRELNDDAA